MSGGRAWTIRRHCLELWPGLVLHGIGKYTFQHLTVNWKALRPGGSGFDPPPLHIQPPNPNPPPPTCENAISKSASAPPGGGVRVLTPPPLTPTRLTPTHPHLRETQFQNGPAIRLGGGPCIDPPARPPAPTCGP